MRLNSLSLQKKFSIRWRHLYISASIWSGVVRRGCCEITTLAPRSSRSAMMSLLSKALSAIRAPNSRPSISGATPAVSKRWPGQQHKADEVAQGIGQGENLGRHAALGAANGLARSPPFAPSVAVHLDDGGIDHGVFHVRLIRDRIEQPFENIGSHPVAIP